MINFPPPPARIKIKGITIRGERHTGTGFLRALIIKNCPEMTFRIECTEFRGDLFTYDLRKNCANDEVDPWLHNMIIDEKYGWRHSKIDTGKFMDPEDLMVVIFRKASSWIPKMQKLTYSASPEVIFMPKNAILTRFRAKTCQFRSFSAIFGGFSATFARFFAKPPCK